MTHRNEALWEEIWELSVFKDAESPAYQRAWKYAEELAEAGVLRVTDLLSLQALIRVAIEHGRWEGEQSAGADQ